MADHTNLANLSLLFIRQADHDVFEALNVFAAVVWIECLWCVNLQVTSTGPSAHFELRPS